MRIGSILLVVWLVIGLVAAIQRGYLQGDDDVDCATASTIAVTIVAGPLNYLGVNPKIDCDDINVDVDVDLPEPSQ
jgi:LytS/YehU family sensor histidine kinase